MLAVGPRIPGAGSRGFGTQGKASPRFSPGTKPSLNKMRPQSFAKSPTSYIAWTRMLENTSSPHPEAVQAWLFRRRTACPLRRRRRTAGGRTRGPRRGARRPTDTPWRRRRSPRGGSGGRASLWVIDDRTHDSFPEERGGSSEGLPLVTSSARFGSDVHQVPERPARQSVHEGPSQCHPTG